MKLIITKRFMLLSLWSGIINNWKLTMRLSIRNFLVSWNLVFEKFGVLKIQKILKLWKVRACYDESFCAFLKEKKKWRMISLRYKYIATGVNSRNQAAIPQFVFELLEGLWHDNRRRETTRNCRLLELLIRIWSFPVHKQLNWRAAWMWRFPRKL